MSLTAVPILPAPMTAIRLMTLIPPDEGQSVDGDYVGINFQNVDP